MNWMILINFWAFPVFTLRLTLIFFPGLTVSLEAVTERLESEVFYFTNDQFRFSDVLNGEFMGVGTVFIQIVQGVFRFR